MYFEKLIEFTINTIEDTPEARKFAEWILNSPFSIDFQVEETTHENKTAIEIVQHNPTFNLDALMDVYNLMELNNTKNFATFYPNEALKIPKRKK